LFFGLTPIQMQFYDQVVNEYFGEEGRFTDAIYQPLLTKKVKQLVGLLDEAGNRTYQHNATCMTSASFTR
jgi:hypothetical protein